jgi:hypothetical protein
MGTCGVTDVVFAGPTIAAAEVQALLPCLCLPPARQGDLWRAVRTHRPAAIGLIDGVFLDVPAVWHREILWALSRGVAVFGAASMGALRAAELHPFGMRGIGRVFDAYRTGTWPGFTEPFEDDDEVAVVHAPIEAGGTALSDAMVDLRATLQAAAAAGVIDRDACQSLVAAMKSLPFPERSFAALAQVVPASLRQWLPENRVAQKRRDAQAMLAAMVAAAGSPFVPSFRFERAAVWERFVLVAERQERREVARGRPGSSLRQEDIAVWFR